LQVESLEDRLAPSVFLWTGGAGDAAGAWSNGANWSTGTPPQAEDIVKFTGVNSNNTSTVDVPFEIDKLYIGPAWKGTINAKADVTIDTLFDLESGTFGGDGKLTLGNGGATHTWKAGKVVIGSGGWEVDGQLRIGGATISPTVLELSGGGTLTNHGIIYQDTSVQLARLTDIFNDTDGTYQIDADTDNPLIPPGKSINLWQAAGTSRYGQFDNSGVLNVHSKSRMVPDFIFTGGTVNVDGVALSLGYTPGSSGATFNISDQDVHGQSSNGVIEINTGLFSGAYLGTGAGTVIVDNTFEVASSATLDFPVGMFQLFGDIDVDPGATLTNLSTSTINLMARHPVDFTTGTGTFVNQGTIRKAGGYPTTASFVRHFINDSGTIDVESGTIDIYGGSSGTTTFSDGGAFIVGDGARLTLSGPTGSLAGTFTGSGAGSVALNSGTFEIGSAGATFNFPPGLLHWNGGTLDVPAGGALTNVGSLQLSDVPLNTYPVRIFDGGGSLINSGAIVHNGPSNLEIDNGSSLVNQPGAVYKMQGTGGISQGGSGTSSFVNAGRLAKSSSATTSISVGSFNNTGSVYAYAGAVQISSSVIQVSNGTLTGGTWFINAGATLDLSGGGAISTNNALIVLNGFGANFRQITGLTTNDGTLLLKNGASFGTEGDFTNNGIVTLLVATTFNVTGNFTQGSTGLINLEVGGAPGSSLYGLFNVSGSANLAGIFNAQLANSFVPTTGQSFEIMTFASLVSPFTTVRTHPPSVGVSFVPDYLATSLELVA
jgi:hypothetical protein